MISSATNRCLTFAVAMALCGSPYGSVVAAPNGNSVADYYRELESAKLVDASTGSEDTLRAEVRAAEKLLRGGAPLDAAVRLFSIVESPRYADFGDFVEYQNAEYYLGVSLHRSNAYQSALVYYERVLRRGPSATYFAPAHRKVVDIAIATRDWGAILKRLDAIPSDSLPVSATGERIYLQARVDYAKGDFTSAEGGLAKISRKSRLYSSALYLRGVIRTRRGEYSSAAEALCEIVDTPDNDKFTFVIDDRYFTIKDLARLGLGRIAHEQGEYNDAYYHYFQIPEDSDRLAEALFEAAWSMYQKRELATSRDLVKEFIALFPASPLTPEARLLAAYIELADCKFSDALTTYETLIKSLQPVVNEVSRLRKSEDLRSSLFARALSEWRTERADPTQRVRAPKPENARDIVAGLLRLDPQYLRLHEAIVGLDRAAASAPHVRRSWQNFAARLATDAVGAVKTEEDPSQAVFLSSLAGDTQHLADELARSRRRVRQAVREGTISKSDARAEQKRLAALDRKIGDLLSNISKGRRRIDDGLTRAARPKLLPMVSQDIAKARSLEGASAKLRKRLRARAASLSKQRIDGLHNQLRRVLDKAKLGRIDAVIGQKRRLEIEVQDLAQGRFPPELHGKLWEEGLIGDDEVYWPFEGEYWADEYEGWR